MAQEYAYVTGGAGGIGLAVANLLIQKGIKVFITDLDTERLQATAASIGASHASVDVTDWESQVKAFQQAVTECGRIDYVYPIAGIGERTWIPKSEEDFVKPDLSVMEVNVNGLMYTVSLAIQQFRKQGIGSNGFRGKSKSSESPVFDGCSDGGTL
jgi:NADP-dependent 3-hydroxy acid dehydrogenase YdfG